MFGNLKKWGTRKLLESQLKNAPKEQQELIMTMFEKDPKLFESIAKEIQEEKKKGLSEMQAAMKVMPKYQAQMQALLGNKVPMRGGPGFDARGRIRR